jgi:hypothetical protein
MSRTNASDDSLVDGVGPSKVETAAVKRGQRRHENAKVFAITMVISTRESRWLLKIGRSRLGTWKPLRLSQGQSAFAPDKSPQLRQRRISPF